jgi:hypothetical protein
VGHSLKLWGFTPHKPIGKAHGLRPAAVQQWLDERHPKLAARAKRQGAEIHWGDEHRRAARRSARTRRSATCASCRSRRRGSGSTSSSNPFAMPRENVMGPDQ